MGISINIEKAENGRIIRVSSDPDCPGAGKYVSKKFIAKTDAEAAQIAQQGLKARPVGKDHRQAKKGSKGRRRRGSIPTLSVGSTTKRGIKLTARKKA